MDGETERWVGERERWKLIVYFCTVVGYTRWALLVQTDVVRIYTFPQKWWTARVVMCENQYWSVSSWHRHRHRRGEKTTTKINTRKLYHKYDVELNGSILMEVDRINTLKQWTSIGAQNDCFAIPREPFRQYLLSSIFSRADNWPNVNSIYRVMQLLHFRFRSHCSIPFISGCRNPFKNGNNKVKCTRPHNDDDDRLCKWTTAPRSNEPNEYS